MNKMVPGKPARSSRAKKRGLIQIYTGDGKGKTTAALGLAVRAAGAGIKTAIVYFDKGGDHYSERRILDEYLRDRIKYIVTGLDRFDPRAGTFRFGVTAADKREAKRGLAVARNLFKKKEHDLIILDEIITAVTIGLLDEEPVIRLLKAKPPRTELVLTGRHCSQVLAEMADLVSEIKDIRHYLRVGVRARRGFDY